MTVILCILICCLSGLILQITEKIVYEKKACFVFYSLKHLKGLRNFSVFLFVCMNDDSRKKYVYPLQIEKVQKFR